VRRGWPAIEPDLAALIADMGLAELEACRH